MRSETGNCETTDKHRRNAMHLSQLAVSADLASTTRTDEVNTGATWTQLAVRILLILLLVDVIVIAGITGAACGFRCRRGWAFILHSLQFHHHHLRRYIRRRSTLVEVA
jgi:hypothetical protein